MDEVYYLYGLSLEQNGETKDIKKAYASYKKVVDSWPESQFWDQAMSRMAFLERHYLNIR
jgi:outer membrane protein assembly factor BamD (BamD/ComL family)